MASGKKKGKGGRPARRLDEPVTLTNPDGSARVVLLKDRILSVIRGGNFPLTAARACGVCESLWYKWLKKDTPEFVEFREAVKAAEYEAEAVAVGRIQQAGSDPKLWTANAWFLERKFPDRWGQTVKIEQRVEQELDAMFDKLEAGLSHEEFARVVALIAPGEGGPPAGREPPKE